MKEAMKESRRACHDHAAHAHAHGEKRIKYTVIRIVLSFLLALAAFLIILRLETEPGWKQAVLYLPAFLTVGLIPLAEAARNVFGGELFDENLLMIIAAVGAFALGEYLEGMAVMLLFQTGEVFQTVGVARSRKSIGSLMEIQPETANRELPGNPGVYEEVSPEAVQPGDVILVKPGERVPLDGLILEGDSSADTSALTGESLPAELHPGDAIVSGCILIGRPVKLRVTKAYRDSTVARILDLVENAAERKSKSENFITKFARIYTPAVVFCAVLLAVLPPLITGSDWSEWIGRALSFLVVSCPCALVISVPLSFYMGIGTASKRGILIKGSQYVDTLARAGIAVFDKTGTLTKGRFEVIGIDTAAGFSEEELLRSVAYAESYSNHPIARSVTEYYTGRTGVQPDPSVVQNFEEIPGRGIRAEVSGKRILVGNPEIASDPELTETLSAAAETAASAILFVIIDGIYAGYIAVADVLKPETPETLRLLKERYAVRKTVMVTGDTEAVAQRIAEEAGIDAVHAGCLPEEKVALVEQIKKEVPAGTSLIYTGDGINDAPVLACADVGIAMGGIGSDAAIEAADVVIMQDHLSSVAAAVGIARKTVGTAKANILFSLVVKGVILVLSALGLGNMWIAVFADVGVSLLAIGNALLIGRRARR